MRRRAIVGTSAACAVIVLGACSLAVSTSGLSGGVDGTSSEGGAAGEDGGTPRADGGQPVSDSGADAAPDPHLLAEYSFEDGIGSMAHDSSGNAHDALLQLGASFAPDGVRGGALAVNGNGFMVVDALAGIVQFPASGTLSIWFRYSFPKSSTQQRSIFDVYENGRSHLFIRRADGATGSHFQFAAQSSASTTSYAFAGNFDTEPNVWTHLVFTWDAVRSEAAFYVGGVLVKKEGYALTFGVEGQLFRIGEGMIGGFDEVRLFDRVMSPDEAGKLD